ncbi:MAG: hypothetical protein HOI19_03495, partial [Rhodospirillaceae bacterium]|nr:hypothetical protein [Rhodospirillaceae bacterium]
MFRRNVLTGVLLLAILVGGGFARAGELLITASTIPGFDPGMIIEGSQSVSVSKGHKLSLISPTGKVVNITGPYDGVLDPSVSDKNKSKLLTALSILVSGDGKDSTQLGAIRDAASARGRDPFRIDVTASGAQCAIEGKPVTLWMPRGEPLEKIWLERKGSSDAAVVRWPAGESEQPWPKSLAVNDGATYQLLLQPAKKETELLLRVIPAGVAGNKALLAAAMGERGCDSQAIAVLQSPGG